MGGLAIVGIPILAFRQVVPIYANNRVANFVASEGFDGLAGNPFLDLFRWSNGNGGELCMSYEPPEE